MKLKNGKDVNFNDVVIGRQDPLGVIAGSVVTINPANPKIANDVDTIGVNCLRMVRPVTENGKDGAYHADNVKCFPANFVLASDALDLVIGEINKPSNPA